MNSIITYIKKLLQLYVILHANIVMANFGESCVSLPNSSSDNYLVTGTAYGQLINSIDMTTYIANACDSTDVKFSFCLKTDAETTPPCKSITLEVKEMVSLNAISDSPDLGNNNLLGNIPLTVQVIGGNKMCLMMPTSRGQLPVACKATILPSTIGDTQKEEKCTIIGTSCYDGHLKSQSLFNFSGMAITCLQETLNKVFYTGGECNAHTVKMTLLAPFADFQKSLKSWVRAALMMYVIFYGFKVVMNTEYVNLDKVAMFVLKFIFVVYFAVGLGPSFFKYGKETTRNGMVEYGLPFLAGATSSFAEIVFNSGGSKGLCQFDAAKYQLGYEYYAIWDAIDCRLAYYFGMRIMYNLSDLLRSAADSTPTNSSTAGTVATLGLPSVNALDVLKKSSTAFSFFPLTFGFFMAGNIMIVISSILFFIMFISIILHFITSYLVCLVTLYVMAYISPIFIPLSLFEKTKAYFDSWLKIVISCVLQPAVIAGFIALLLTMYDRAIYKNCQFQRHDYSIATASFSTFELQLPIVDSQQCQNSAGYKLLQYYTGQGWEKITAILFPIYRLLDIFALSVDLLYVLIFCIIFYFFSQSISQFAAEITGGPVMSKVVAGPTKLLDAAMKAASAIKKAGAAAYSKGGGGGAAASRSRGRGGGQGATAKDSTSQGNKGGGAKDSISGGGKK